MRVAILVVFLLPLAGASHVPTGDVAWACGFGGSGQRGHPDDCGIDAVGGQGVGAAGPLTTTKTSWLAADDEVLGLTLDGASRAYPIKLLVTHEIANDELAGVPVAVTYCPLCGSGIAFERTIDGEVRSFTASGFLWQHDLVMWDPTGTLWNQITGEAIGTLVDNQVQADHQTAALQTIPVLRTTWGSWLERHPDTTLVEPVFAASRYDREAYRGYSTSCTFGISRQGTCDLDGLHPKAEVVGVAAASPVAFALLGVLAEGGVAVHEGVVLAATLEGDIAAFDAGNRTFTQRDGFWVDGAGRPWSLAEGMRADGTESLAPLEAHRMFWFAWQTHHPNTTLWLPADESVAVGPDPVDDGRLPGFWLPVVGTILLVAALWYRRRS